MSVIEQFLSAILAKLIFVCSIFDPNRRVDPQGGAGGAGGGQGDGGRQDPPPVIVAAQQGGGLPDWAYAIIGVVS